MTEKEWKIAFSANPELAMRWGIHIPTEKPTPRSVGACPECGSSEIQMQGRCHLCVSCGWTSC